MFVIDLAPLRLVCALDRCTRAAVRAQSRPDAMLEPPADHVAKRMTGEGPPGPNCPGMILRHLPLVCSSAAASHAASLLAHALTAVIGAAYEPPMMGGGSGDGSGGEAAGRQWSQGVTGGPVWTLEGPVWTRVAAVRRQLCVMCVLLCVC